MSEYRGEIKKVEHAFHVGEKREKRRKLMQRSIKTIIATGAAAATFLGVGKFLEQRSEAHYQPDSYYNGRVEVIMSPNLNVREDPIVITNRNEPPNTVNWKNVEEINGVKIKGNESFVITNPLITKGDNPATNSVEKGAWITFDAKVDQPFGNPKEETLYVSLSSATRGFVIPIEPGSFVKLDNLTSTNDLGKVSLNP